MKYTARILVLAFVSLYLGSCEKVIEYDLNDSKPRYVIEGSVSDQEGQCRVKISKSVNFSDSNTFPGISGAIVSISDDHGDLYVLNETEPGIYTSAYIKGIPGQTYQLNVIIGDETFTASSYLPEPVNFDTIEYNELSTIGGTQKVTVPVYLDPENSTNYYRFTQTINQIKTDPIFVRDDKQSNGRLVKQPLFNFSDDSLKSGDIVEIEMLCIDRAVYEYFFALSQITGSNGPNGTGTPANPVSNISGGVLGYFSAHTSQVKTSVVP